MFAPRREGPGTGAIVRGGARVIGARQAYTSTLLPLADTAEPVDTAALVLALVPSWSPSASFGAATVGRWTGAATGLALDPEIETLISGLLLRPGRPDGARSAGRSPVSSAVAVEGCDGARVSRSLGKRSVISVVHRGAADLVVGVEERLGQHCADVAAAQSVDDPPALSRAFDQPGETQLRQMLAGHRGAAPRDRGEAGDVEVLIPQGPQDPDPGRVGQQGEGHHCGIDLCGGR